MIQRIRVAEVARQQKNWSMRRVSEELEVDHQTVLYWNQGKSYPRLPMLVRLLKLLGCSFQELVDC
jgi:transcriptional regulator with XRE-family HTH domain